MRSAYLQRRYRTFEDRTDFPYWNWSLTIVLAEDELHIEEWHRTEDQHQHVRNKEGTWKSTKIVICINFIANVIARKSLKKFCRIAWIACVLLKRFHWWREEEEKVSERNKTDPRRFYSRGMGISRRWQGRQRIQWWREGNRPSSTKFVGLNLRLPHGVRIEMLRTELGVLLSLGLEAVDLFQKYTPFKEIFPVLGLLSMNWTDIFHLSGSPDILNKNYGYHMDKKNNFFPCTASLLGSETAKMETFFSLIWQLWHFGKRGQILRIHYSWPLDSWRYTIDIFGIVLSKISWKIDILLFIYLRVHWLALFPRLSLHV